MTTSNMQGLGWEGGWPILTYEQYKCPPGGGGLGSGVYWVGRGKKGVAYNRFQESSDTTVFAVMTTKTDYMPNQNPHTHKIVCNNEKQKYNHLVY